MLTGVQITERVKQHPATQHVPVVVISTSMLASDREAALAAGCDRYVSLPCTPEDLVVVLRRVIAAK